MCFEFQCFSRQEISQQANNGREEDDCDGQLPKGTCMKAMKNPHGMCPLTAYFNANKDSHPDDKPPLKQCDRPLHIISVLQDRAQVFYDLPHTERRAGVLMHIPTSQEGSAAMADEDGSNRAAPEVVEGCPLKCVLERKGTESARRALSRVGRRVPSTFLGSPKGCATMPHSGAATRFQRQSDSNLCNGVGHRYVWAWIRCRRGQCRRSQWGVGNVFDFRVRVVLTYNGVQLQRPAPAARTPHYEVSTPDSIPVSIVPYPPSILPYPPSILPGTIPTPGGDRHCRPPTMNAHRSQEGGSQTWLNGSNSSSLSRGFGQDIKQLVAAAQQIVDFFGAAADAAAGAAAGAAKRGILVSGVLGVALRVQLLPPRSRRGWGYELGGTGQDCCEHRRTSGVIHGPCSRTTTG